MLGNPPLVAEHCSPSNRLRSNEPPARPPGQREFPSPSLHAYSGRQARTLILAPPFNSSPVAVDSTRKAEYVLRSSYDDFFRPDASSVSTPLRWRPFTLESRENLPFRQRTESVSTSRPVWTGCHHLSGLGAAYYLVPVTLGIFFFFLRPRGHYHEIH